MRIRRIYQFLSSALIVLPVLILLVYRDRLPDRLPLHFDQFGQADRFGTRSQWLTSVSWSILLLSLLRIVFFQLVGRQPGIGRSQLIRLYVLTGVLMVGASLLLIGQGIYQKPLYQEWLPLLFFSFGSVFIYYGVPPDLPAAPQNEPRPNLPLVRQLANRRRIHTLTRLVTIRVNLLAVLVMFFVRGQDRWSVGILANLLVYVYLAGLSFYLNRNVDQG